MKKMVKRLIILLIVLLFLAASFIAAWTFLIFPNFVSPKIESEKEEAEIAAAPENMELNESNGVRYMNNEVIVFVRASAAQDEIDDLFASYEAQVDDSMAEIGLYRLLLPESMDYDKLEDLVEDLKDEPNVEEAYLNPVVELEADDTETEDDFPYQDPFYPNDPWNQDAWDVDVPRGENWGMEAIDAPGAWGYLDRLNRVKVGLIDTLPDTSHKDLNFSNISCLFIDEETGKTNVNQYNLTPDDHGTHVAGTMNAKWDNAEGVSGVMGGRGDLYYSAVYYESKGPAKYATAYSYLLALKTLIDQDVQVINISQHTNRLIGFAASHGNQNAIRYLSLQADLTEKGLKRIIEAREAAGKPDFLICMSAGNSNNLYYYKDEKAVYGYREEMTDWEEVKYLFGWRGEIGNSLALYNNFLNMMDEEEVKNRVIVVGAVGVDTSSSTSQNTQYSYANFSNVGSRVDIVAPGVDIYSCKVGRYEPESGTSMAAPHVSGAAGLAFGANPLLTGPEVKEILIASSVGRYYHGNEYSGLLNVNHTVVNALKTVDTSVPKVLNTQTDNGLDLCFVVDTTGSMGDDIDNAKANMANILEHLGEKTGNYRVALIDYRDFPDRSAHSEDYSCRVQLHFTSDNASITAAINGLDLGHGGDGEETVYSALMSAVDLDWRSDAKKVIIILGDAAPLDPEPVTGYTYDQVLLALFNADIRLDYEESDRRVVDSLDTSLINVFSIGADASSDAADFFEAISSNTGGSYASVEDASEVSDAIINSIEQIEVEETINVLADFSDSMANRKINLYSGSEYLFTIETDENGQFMLENMDSDLYRWTSNGLYGSGTLEIGEEGQKAAVQLKNTYWFSPLLLFWQRYTLQICAGLLGFIAICAIIPLSIRGLQKLRRRKKALPAEPFPEHENDLYCPNCGSPVNQGAQFCRNCGSKIENDRK